MTLRLIRRANPRVVHLDYHRFNPVRILQIVLPLNLRENRLLNQAASLIDFLPLRQQHIPQNNPLINQLFFLLESLRSNQVRFLLANHFQALLLSHYRRHLARQVINRKEFLPIVPADSHQVIHRYSLFVIPLTTLLSSQHRFQLFSPVFYPAWNRLRNRQFFRLFFHLSSQASYQLSNQRSSQVFIRQFNLSLIPLFSRAFNQQLNRQVSRALFPTIFPQNSQVRNRLFSPILSQLASLRCNL
jgi:hypothetical protein